LVNPLVIADRLHLLERISYRMLRGEFRIGINGDTSTFRVSKIQMSAKVSPVVFDNSRITKMDDSPPLDFFCRETLMSVFDAGWRIELLTLLPWFLLISGLTTFDV
jgi:hypothetical protein